MLSGLYRLTKEEADSQEMAVGKQATQKHQQLTSTDTENPDDTVAEVPEMCTYYEDEIIGYIVLLDSPSPLHGERQAEND